MRSFIQLLRNSRGAAAVEFGLVLGLLVIGLFGAITALGTETTKSFDSTAQKVADAT